MGIGDYLLKTFFKKEYEKIKELSEIVSKASEESPKSASQIRILYMPIGYIEAGRKLMQKG